MRHTAVFHFLSFIILLVHKQKKIIYYWSGIRSFSFQSLLDFIDDSVSNAINTVSAQHSMYVVHFGHSSYLFSRCVYVFVPARTKYNTYEKIVKEIGARTKEMKHTEDDRIISDLYWCHFSLLCLVVSLCNSLLCMYIDCTYLYIRNTYNMRRCL